MPRRSRRTSSSRARCASRRRASTIRHAAVAASRISPTRRRSEAKEEQVADALRRIGGIAEPPLEPILPAEEIFHYRNKLEYSFTQTEDGPTLGFHKAGRWDEVLEIEHCWLTTELGNAIRNSVRDWARGDRLVAYDQAEHTGYLRHLVVREGRGTRRRCSSSS